MNETMSGEVAALAAALARAQGALKAAGKGGTNPHLKNKYSTLADLWDACRKALSENELAVTQTFAAQDDAGLVLVTTLLHSSGQWLRSELRVPLERPTAQAIGSAATYARRYGLAAIVGVVPVEDDDGSAATVAAPSGTKPRPAPSLPPTPEETLCPFGEKKGVPLGKIPDTELASLATWCRKREKYPDISAACEAVITNRAQARAREAAQVPFDELPLGLRTPEAP